MAESVVSTPAAGELDKVPEAELCDFVNTDTGKRCQRRALWKCAASGIVACVRTCTVHSRPFLFKAGCSAVKIVRAS